MGITLYRYTKPYFGLISKLSTCDEKSALHFHVMMQHMKRRYRTVELFAGTCSFSKVMKAHGHSTLTIDNDPKFNTDECINILACRDTDYKFKNTDIMWASPPCQGFSVAVIGRNWHHGGKPKTDSARLAMKLAKKTLSIIEASKPKYYFIENPLAMPRKMPFMTAFLRRTGGVRHSITYCQYGDTRQKPTDIWTNATWFKPHAMCKRGAPCHVAAPRGSQSTQGMKNATEKGRIPPALFEQILKQMPK